MHYPPFSSSISYSAWNIFESSGISPRLTLNNSSSKFGGSYPALLHHSYTETTPKFYTRVILKLYRDMTKNCTKTSPGRHHNVTKTEGFLQHSFIKYSSLETHREHMWRYFWQWHRILPGARFAARVCALWLELVPQNFKHLYKCIKRTIARNLFIHIFL